MTIDIILLFIRLISTMVLLAAIVIMYISIRPLSEGIIKDIFRSMFYFSVFVLIIQMITVLFSSAMFDEVMLIASIMISFMAFGMMISSGYRIAQMGDAFGLLINNDMINKENVDNGLFEH